MSIPAKRVEVAGGLGTVLVQDLHGVKTQGLPMKLPAQLLAFAKERAAEQGVSLSLFVAIGIEALASSLEAGADIENFLVITGEGSEDNG